MHGYVAGPDGYGMAAPTSMSFPAARRPKLHSTNTKHRTEVGMFHPPGDPARTEVAPDRRLAPSPNENFG
jgi:hypothetical protein